MSFRVFVVFVGAHVVGPKYNALGSASNPPPVSGGSTHLDKGYSPTDVLAPLPGATDVLDVLYHCYLCSDKCVAVLCTYNT